MENKITKSEIGLDPTRSILQRVCTEFRDLENLFIAPGPSTRVVSQHLSVPHICVRLITKRGVEREIGASCIVAPEAQNNLSKTTTEY